MLIERGAELGLLRAAVSRAVDGAGAALVVLGPPGIGKTTLLDEALADLPGPACVLRARGGELEAEFPWGVARQLFEGAVRAADAAQRAELLSGPARPAAAVLDGDPARDAHPDPDAAPAGPSDAATLEHAFFRLAAGLADAGPLIVVVDDLQWADSSSLRWLIYLCRRLSDRRIAVLTTCRSGAVARQPLLARLAGESTVLEPAPISADGARRYLRERLDGPDDSFCAAGHAATGGNPFLLFELVDAVRSSGIDPIAANAGRLRALTASNVTRTVQVRLSGLSPDAAPVARAIAVLGQTDRIQLVARLAQRTVDVVAAAVDELRAAHILATGEQLRFVHDIVHSAVLAAIAPAERSAAHKIAARLLRELGAPPDAVAGHLLATIPDGDRWVFEQLSDAAARGLAASTPETAAAYLDRALQESTGTPAERLPLLMRLGGARYQTVEGGAVASFTAALALADNLPLRLEIGRALASAYMTERRYDECWALIDRLLADADGHPELTCDVELFAAQALYTDLDGAIGQLATVARWQPDERGATRRDRSMLATRAWTRMCLPAKANLTTADARAALSTGSLVSDDSFYVTYEMAVWALIASGCHDEALASLDAAIESRRRIGQLLRAATLMVLRAELLRRLGRLADAEADARFAVDTIPAQQVYALQAASALILVLVSRGELRSADAVLIESGFAETDPSGGLSDLLWLARGSLRVAAGELDSGLADVLRYGAISERLGRRHPGYFAWRATAVEALVRLGRREDAARLAADELALAEQAGVAAVRGRSLGALGLTQRGRAAVRTLTTAVEVLDAAPLVLDSIEARFRLGRALRLVGERDAARDHLRQALDAATRCGASPLAEAAHDELVAAGARPRRRAIQGPDALTPSEHRVARLAAQGLTNRELAHTLFVTPKTIEAHLAAAYRKLGIAGRADLAQALPAS